METAGGASAIERVPENDDRLLERAASGDGAAFEAFVRRFEAPVFRFLRRVLGSDSLADEARQAAFVRAFTHVGEYRGGSARSWLFRTAYRVALNLRRDEARAAVGPLEEPDALPDRTPPPESLLSAEEERAAVRRALERLDAGDRALLWLRVAEGLTLAESAEILGAPASTIRYRLVRSLRKVRRELISPTSKGDRHGLP